MHASQSESHVCEVLRSVSSSFEHLAHVYADAHAIHTTDFRALLMICSRDRAEATMSAGELASHLGLSSGAITYLVERLTQSGHVARQVDPGDRRRVLLTCTDSGRELATGFSDPVCEAAEKTFEGLDEATVGHLLTVLGSLSQSLNGRADEFAAAAGA